MTVEKVALSEIIGRLEAGVSVIAEGRPALLNERGVLKVSAVTGGVFKPEENKLVTNTSEMGRLAVSPTKGNIIMTRANGSKELVGCSVYVHSDHPTLFLSDKLWRLSVKDNTRDVPEWLFQVLNLDGIRREVIESASGSSGMRNISKQAFLKITVSRPPFVVQHKIATILSTWDRAIELAEKLIAAKQLRKAALMQQLLSGKVRFRQFVKSNGRHKTPVGGVPVEWKLIRLDKVLTKVKRKNAVGETHVLTASGEHGLVDQTDFFNRSVAGKDLSGYYLLKRGEFAYNRSAMNGYPFGAIKRLDQYKQGVLSTLYICFGLVEGACDSDFITHYFEARLLDRQLGEVTQVGGRAHGLLNITDGDFYSMHIVLPELEEQRMIAAVLSEQDREIDLQKQKLDALRRQKKGLAQQLLTGKVPVKITETSGV